MGQGSERSIGGMVKEVSVSCAYYSASIYQAGIDDEGDSCDELATGPNLVVVERTVCRHGAGGYYEYVV